MGVHTGLQTGTSQSLIPAPAPKRDTTGEQPDSSTVSDGLTLWPHTSPAPQTAALRCVTPHGHSVCVVSRFICSGRRVVLLTEQRKEGTHTGTHTHTPRRGGPVTSSVSKNASLHYISKATFALNTLMFGWNMLTFALNTLTFQQFNVHEELGLKQRSSRPSKPKLGLCQGR